MPVTPAPTILAAGSMDTSMPGHGYEHARASRPGPRKGRGPLPRRRRRPPLWPLLICRRDGGQSVGGVPLAAHATDGLRAQARRVGKCECEHEQRPEAGSARALTRKRNERAPERSRRSTPFQSSCEFVSACSTVPTVPCPAGVTKRDECRH
jgi:hypothetical protein